MPLHDAVAVFGTSSNKVLLALTAHWTLAEHDKDEILFRQGEARPARVRVRAACAPRTHALLRLRVQARRRTVCGSCTVERFSYRRGTTVKSR